MQKGAKYFGVTDCFKFIEDLVYRTGNNPSIVAFKVFGFIDLLTICFRSEHRKRLPWACLPIGENSNIVSIQNSGYHSDKAIIDAILLSGGFKGVIEGDFKVIIGIMSDSNGSILPYPKITSESTSTTWSEPLSEATVGLTLTKTLMLLVLAYFYMNN